MDNNIFYASSPKSSKDDIKGELPAADRPGFTSEEKERAIDLNKHLIKNGTASFLMRVNSDAMTGAGINRGDVVIVDRSLEPSNGKVIIAEINGELLIRTYEISHGKRRLLPATKKISPIDIVEYSGFSVWGVVTYVIHPV